MKYVSITEAVLEMPVVFHWSHVAGDLGCSMKGWEWAGTGVTILTKQPLFDEADADSWQLGAGDNSDAASFDE